MNVDVSEVEKKLVTIADYFTPGQYVCATVLRMGNREAHTNPAIALASTLTGTDISHVTNERRIALSLRPELYNTGIELDTLRKGSFLWGYVRSVEDHGYVVSTGIEGVSAFLPFSNTDGTSGQPGTKLLRHAPGTPIFTTVQHINRASKALTLTTKVADVTSAVSKEPSHTIFTVKPGMLVDVTVDRVIVNGLAATFLSFFHSTISLAHLSTPAHALWAEQYSPGQEFRARVLWVNTVDKAIALSAASHVVSLGTEDAVEGDSVFGINGPHFSVRDGEVIEDAIVLRVDPDMGALVGWGHRGNSLNDGRRSEMSDKAVKSELLKKLNLAGTSDAVGYLHISRVSDSKISSIEKELKLGGSIKVRVIGFQGIEGYASLSAKPSVVEASVLRVTDCVPGSIVSGIVSEILVDKEGDPKSAERVAAVAAGKGIVATVKLGENVVAMVPALHVADALPAHAFASNKTRSRFFASAGLIKGAKIRARVLTMDPGSGRVQLTLKRTLLGEEGVARAGPIGPETAKGTINSATTAYELLQQAKANSTPLFAHGWVSAIKEEGIAVTFFGNVYGFVPTGDLVEAGIIPKNKVKKSSDTGGLERVTAPLSLMNSTYSLGQIIRVRVISASLSQQRLKLSVNLSTTTSQASSASADVDESAPATSNAVPETLPEAGAFVKAEVHATDATRILLKVLSYTKPLLGKGFPKDAEKLQPSGTLYAELPFLHLSDHPSSAEALAALPCYNTPGTVLENLLVLAPTTFATKESTTAAPTRPLLTLTAKPLLVQTALHGPADALPTSAATLRPGILATGFVASAVASGTFVRYLNGCTGFAPYSKTSDSASQELPIGQSVVTVVRNIHSIGDGTRPGRFTVSIAPEDVSRMLNKSLFTESAPTLDAFSNKPSPELASLCAQWLRTIILDAERALAASPIRLQQEDSEDEEENDSDDASKQAGVPVAVPSRYVYRPGAKTVARVQMISKQGLLLELPSPSPAILSQSDVEAETLPPIMAFAPANVPHPEALEDISSLKEGDVVPVQVLDVETSTEMVTVVVTRSADVPTPGKRARNGKGQKQSSVQFIDSLSAPLVPDYEGVSSFKLGNVVSTTVLACRKDSPYAIVWVPNPDAPAQGHVAFAALDDFIGIKNAQESVSAGDKLEVVVTQLPELNEVSKKEKSQLTTHIASVSRVATDALFLVSAAPTLVKACKVLQSGGNLKKSKSNIANLIDFASLVPGTMVTAVVPKDYPKNPLTAVAASTFLEHAMETSEGLQAIQNLALKAPYGRDQESDEEGASDSDSDAPESSSSASNLKRALAPIVLRLHKVRGATYSAYISLAECLDFCPYTGQGCSESSVRAGLARFLSLLTARPGTKFVCKIVSMSVRDAAFSSVKKSKSIDDSARKHYTVHLSVKPSEMSLPDLHLSSNRFIWPSESVVTSPSTVISVAGETVKQTPRSSPLVAEKNASVSAAVTLAPGSTAYGVVEGLSSDGAYLMLGLGGGMRARVFVLDAGNSDSIRDPATGVLLRSEETAKALSLPTLLTTTHPIGSLVPLVITRVSADRKQVDASIRQAKSALAVAKKAGPANKTTFEATSQAVNKWLLSNRPEFTPGEIVFARVWNKTESSATTSDYVAAVNDATSVLANVFSSMRTKTPGSATFLRLQLCSKTVGRVDITHFQDRANWKNAPLSRTHDGDVVLGVLLPPVSKSDASASDPVLSLRPSWIRAVQEQKKKTQTKELLTSLLEEEMTAVAQPGTLVSGYIASSGKKGAFVRLALSTTCRISLSKLADSFITDPSVNFPPGRLVTGRVLSYDQETKHIDFSLRQRDISGKKDTSDNVELAGFEDLQADTLVTGTITKVETFGVFITLDNTDRFKTSENAKSARKSRIVPISGLCHVSEIDDVEEGTKPRRVPLKQRFNVGDIVQVAINSVDLEKKNVLLSLKPSRIRALETQDDEDDDEVEFDMDDEEISSGEMDSDEELVEDEDEDDEEDDDDEADEDEDVEDAYHMLNDSDAEEMEEDEESDDDDDDDIGAKKAVGGVFANLESDSDASDSETDTKKDDMSAPSAMFSWKQASGKNWLGGDDADAFLETSDEEDEEEATRVRSKKQKQKERMLFEEETLRQETRLATGEADENPESEADFERLVLMHPNSSVVWIRYIAFQLSCTEVGKARQVAERALETIGYREEQERANVWTAYLNLEVMHGDQSSVAKVFARACGAADPRAMHVALLNIYQKPEVNKVAEAKALFAATMKKFGKDGNTRANVELWALWAAFLFRNGEAEAGRGLLNRAMAITPKNTHVDLILKFALLEYRFAVSTDSKKPQGSQERGRTLLDGLLSTFPKRLDIWSVYIDQECSLFAKRYEAAVDTTNRAVDLKFVRQLFQRAAALKQSSKKMKFLFKKWLSFERKLGDAKGVAAVQDAIRAYVASATGESAGKDASHSSDSMEED